MQNQETAKVRQSFVDDAAEFQLMDINDKDVMEFRVGGTDTKTIKERLKTLPKETIKKLFIMLVVRGGRPRRFIEQMRQKANDPIALKLRNEVEALLKEAEDKNLVIRDRGASGKEKGRLGSVTSSQIFRAMPILHIKVQEVAGLTRSPIKLQDEEGRTVVSIPKGMDWINSFYELPVAVVRDHAKAIISHQTRLICDAVLASKNAQSMNGSQFLTIHGRVSDSVQAYMSFPDVDPKQWAELQKLQSVTDYLQALAEMGDKELITADGMYQRY